MAEFDSHLENIDNLFYGKVIPDEILLAGCYKATLINISNHLGIRDRLYRVCEVGGGTEEHMVNPNVYKNADGVIFVVSMIGYCQAVPMSPAEHPDWELLGEKVLPNQMLQSMRLFEDITKIYKFRTVPILLLLNKLDLLAQKMRTDPIADYFPEYSGDSDPLAACRFFAAEFLHLDSRPEGNLKVVVASAVDPYDLNCTIGELMPELFVEEFVVLPYEEGEEGRLGKDEVK